MSDLIAWLRSCLDEDERRAQAMEHRNIDDGGYYSCPATRAEGEDYGDLPSGEAHCDCGLAARRKRMLAEVESKRQIITAHDRPHHCTYLAGRGDHSVVDDKPWVYYEDEHTETTGGACMTLRLMTIPYVDRPGYDQAWRVE